MHCTNCGKILQEDAKFCEFCGHEVPKNIHERYMQTLNNSSSINTEVKHHSKGIKKHHTLRIFIILGILLLIIIGCSGFLLFENNWNLDSVKSEIQGMLNPNNPSVVFKQVLANQLSTKQVENQFSNSLVNGKGLTYSEDEKYDFTNNNDPKISVLFKIYNSNGSQSTAYSGYGTLQNTYMKYNLVNNKSPLAKSIINKWFVERKDGNLEPSAQVITFDPRHELFGPIIFGNFPDNQKQNLINFLETNNVYSFDPSKVKDVSFEGQTVLIYPITINVSKLVEYNKMVAQLFGVPLNDSYFQDTLKSINKIDDNKYNETWYINKDTKQIIQSVDSINNIVSTSKFVYFNNLAFPSEPRPQITISKFNQIIFEITPSNCLLIQNAQMSMTTIDSPVPYYNASLHNGCNYTVKGVTLKINFYPYQSNSSATPLDTQYVDSGVTNLAPGDSYQIKVAVNTNVDTTVNFNYTGSIDTIKK